MSHTVQVNMIANQEMQWFDKDFKSHYVNIYDIKSIVVTDQGYIVNVFLKEKEAAQHGKSMGSDSKKTKTK